MFTLTDFGLLPLVTLQFTQHSSTKSRRTPMDFYTLSPPNCEALSDTLIGNVVQRTWSSRSRMAGGAGSPYENEDVEEMPANKQRSQRSTYRQTPYSKIKTNTQTNLSEKESSGRGQASPASPLNSVIDLMKQPNSQTGRKRRTLRASDLETASRLIETIQANKRPITAEMQAAIIAEALRQKIQHRERCRVNQARYRQRQQKVEDDIRDNIAKLEAEIKELGLRRLNTPRLPTVPIVWEQASKYLRHFHHFVSSPAPLRSAARTFLQELLSTDVTDGSSFGVEAQIKSWELFALYFANVDLKLKGLSMQTPDTLVADVSIAVTFTHNTPRRAFPHLTGDGNSGADGGVQPPLAAKLLGQRLVMRGSVVFGWDTSSDKVVRLQTRADMLTPMLKMLGNLQDVSCVFQNAKITPECQFV